MTSRIKSGIFVIADIPGAVGERIRTLQTTYDPRLSRFGRPHVTIVGSSGAGPILADTTVDELRERLEPVAADTPPIVLRFGRPSRFMQTPIVQLPLDPHGPLRTLHERIKTSGLRFARPRFFFTPHVTLNLYRELAPDELKTLLAERFDEPVTIDAITCYFTRETGEMREMITLALRGPATSHPTEPQS